MAVVDTVVVRVLQRSNKKHCGWPRAGIIGDNVRMAAGIVRVAVRVRTPDSSSAGRSATYLSQKASID